MSDNNLVERNGVTYYRCPRCRCLLTNNQAYIDGHIEQHTKAFELSQLFWRGDDHLDSRPARTAKKPSLDWYDRRGRGQH